MDLTRLRAGELLAGLAVIGFLASLFLDWTSSQERIGDQVFPVRTDGFEAIGYSTLLVLTAAMLCAIALVVFTVTKRPAAIPIGAAVITTFVGLIAFLVLAVRVVLLDDSLGGAYLGLLSSFLILAGGWITMRDERLNAPYSAAPNLPRRPAPPAQA